MKSSAAMILAVMLSFERHWSAAEREAHERMGLHEGWSQATDQLVELVARL